ncbi:hypothetical protein [Hahella ganghwensis]|uniref:hypothetical protein n=1 Tax=Hahella ganghwensis TaxID=286420 RepID=UPI000367F08C|nr:hypothetical protein [Hahella ganghwensis]
MNIKSGHLEDQVFQAEFENNTLNPECFDHVGHLRIAWLYLQQCDLETALQKTCLGIKSYAESLGAAGKYHHTLTDALVRIMAMRLSETTGESFQAFLEQNSDLVNDALGVVQQYYSQDLLNREEARLSWVAPDLRALFE